MHFKQIDEEASETQVSNECNIWKLKKKNIVGQMIITYANLNPWQVFKLKIHLKYNSKGWALTNWEGN